MVSGDGDVLSVVVAETGGLSAWVSAWLGVVRRTRVRRTADRARGGIGDDKSVRIEMTIAEVQKVEQSRSVQSAQYYVQKPGSEVRSEVERLR